jgi:glutamate/tyrosine decarboxylase-like PLP-dependent enzyme
MSSDDRKKQLLRRHAPLEMSAEEFTRLGHGLVDEIGEWLESLPRRPVNRDESPSELRKLLPGGGLPGEGRDAESLLGEALSLLVDHSLYNGHPRFFGYITSSAAPIGALADLLASSINPNLGGWQLSPIASEIERQCVRWIAEMLGYPVDGAGMLVSGGNMANFVGFLAARRAKGGEEIRQNGILGPRLLAYVSAETHTWIQKAADLFGLGTNSIRWIDVDHGQRIDLDALQRQIERDHADGHRPFLLVGTAGTVSTGAVDPLPDLARIARQHDMWFHADGAYGAFAAIVSDRPPALDALGEADSVAVDPHKWLYAPLEAGCVLVRDRNALRDTFSYTPPYYHFSEDDEDAGINYYEHGMQNSRGFRALKVWLALRQVGREGYERMIGDDIRLTRELFRLIEQASELEARTCELSIATFRFVPEDLEPGSEAVESYLDELNEQILVGLKTGGEAFVSNAVIDGTFLLRTCIVNFRTSLSDVEALPEIVTRLGRETDKVLRPDRLR